MANYYKSLTCPICKSMLSFEDVSTVYEDMARGLDQHLRSHTTSELTEYLEKSISIMAKHERVAMIVSQRLGIIYKTTPSLPESSRTNGI